MPVVPVLRTSCVPFHVQAISVVVAYAVSVLVLAFSPFWPLFFAPSLSSSFLFTDLVHMFPPSLNRFSTDITWVL